MHLQIHTFINRDIETLLKNRNIIDNLTNKIQIMYINVNNKIIIYNNHV